MTKARDLADLIAAGNPLADGAIAYSEVTGTPTLGTAAASATGDFATAAQGTKADAALPKAGGAVTGDVTFGDNDKAIFGAGSDLQIYHSGTHSRIVDSGTGSLLLQGTNLQLQNGAGTDVFLTATENAEVSLRHNNNIKLATTSTGVDVTGEFIADSYNETYAALSGTSPAVNCHNGNSFSLVLSGNTTFTFSNPPASGTAYSFSIEIVQDSGASGYTVTWPSSVDWPAATAPTLTATASAKDIFVFTTRDGGTNWYGFTAGQALA